MLQNIFDGISHVWSFQITFKLVLKRNLLFLYTKGCLLYCQANKPHFPHKIWMQCNYFPDKGGACDRTSFHLFSLWHRRRQPTHPGSQKSSIPTLISLQPILSQTEMAMSSWFSYDPHTLVLIYNGQITAQPGYVGDNPCNLRRKPVHSQDAQEGRESLGNWSCGTCSASVQVVHICKNRLQIETSQISIDQYKSRKCT